MSTTNNAPAHWQAPFFTVWTGQVFSLVGSRLAQFSLVWWLTASTGSATILATSTLVAVLPNVILGPFAGVLIDRWERRKVMIVADSFVAVVSALLAFLFWRGSMQVWHVYVAMLARSLGDVFHSNAMQASTSLMVPGKHLSRVAGINQSMYGALNVVAPPLGALLMTILPLHQIMSIDVATAIVAVSPLFFIAIPQPESRSQPGSAEHTMVYQIRSGLRYVWGWPGLMAIVIVAMVINFIINPAFSLLPLLVTDHFQGGAVELGWLESAWGIGMVLGGLLLSIWGGFRQRIYTSLGGLVLEGLAIMVFGLTPQSAFWLGWAALFAAGIMNPLINGPFFAVLQATVEPEMQGRVFTLVGSLTAAMMPLSLAVAGPLADLIGIRTWYIVGGGAFALIGALSFFVPVITNVETNHAGIRNPELLASCTPKPAASIADGPSGNDAHGRSAATLSG